MSIRRHIFSSLAQSRSRDGAAVPSRSTIHVSRFPNRAFSLIEILVVVALLSVIILGLLAMFDQTKRAFTSGMTQVDVLEGGRSAMEIISRELSQMSPAPYDSNAVTFYAEIPPVSPLWQPLPGNNTEQRRNVLEEMFFLTREGNNWKGIGYWVGAPDTASIPAATANGWGTLYRFQNTNIFRVTQPWHFYGNYNNFNLRTQRMNRIIDGVVHFKVRAFDPSGVWITNSLAGGNTEIHLAQTGAFVTNEVLQYWFTNRAVPAFVELELGVLEARTLARLKSIPDVTARRNYLQEQVGRVHIFRTRVPVRNVEPAAYR